ncbi:carbohydrate ABC transporter permease [Desulfoferrobacter suflitae]|uniref:carbohydrate ABC transporter permease n=1 Tax=Desulfoferrobacter suflitae TaxID=2865782 RepID=UPI0021645CB5|nr:sugar ABC transporter permease [Desulfoferrobacter suflitae]MCK8603052.1 sugar ABC transporter permease [Desulfoferrobacter suflitae]
MKSYRFPELRTTAVFLLPLTGFLVLFILVPVIGAIVDSLYLEVTFLPARFAGFENYRWMVRNPGFWQSFAFTLLFVLVSVPLEIVLGLTFALLLNEKTAARGLLRACVLIPWAIPAAVSARTWELIYNYNYGLANFLWIRLGLSSTPINWLGSELGAFTSLVCADAWKTTPFVAIILLAGLSAIPEDLYRQAEVDGANFFRRFTTITLPLIKPAIIVALIFRSVDALRVFDIVYVLTHGGPGGSTTSLSLYGYNYFLIGDFGYGSAVSVVLFAVALVLSVTYVKIGRFGEDLR